MAQLIKKFVVCDVGMESCDNTKLHKGRVTLDGKTAQVTLCTKHAEPLARFTQGGSKAKAKGRIYDPAEIRRKARGT